MLASILAALVPDGLTSGWSRRAWQTAILLFPMALAAGIWIEIRSTPRPPVEMKLDKQSAVRIARDFLIREGFPAANWSATVGAKLDQDLLRFVDQNPQASPLWKFAPPIRASVVLKPSSGPGSARVVLSLEGAILGFDLKDLPSPGAILSEPEARRMAVARLPPGLKFDEPSLARSGGSYEYTFRSSSLEQAEIKAEVHAEGSRLTFFRVTADPEGGSHHRKPKDNGVAGVLGGISVLFITLIAIYSLYRYGSRTIQQEISHRRSLGVALLCTVFCVLIFYTYTSLDLASQNSPMPVALLLLIFALVGLCGGALLAAAYGSGEGDVREAFPGKLTSVDAFLTGRIASRNVGVSLLFGLAIAGWLILLNSLSDLALGERSSHATPQLMHALMPLHWLLPFLLYPMFAVLFSAAGVLQPLAFLHRNWKRAGRWRLPTLVLCTALVSFVRTGEGSMGIGYLPHTALFVAALLVPFFFRDLLATLVCVAALLASTDYVAGVVALADRFKGEAIAEAIALLATIVFAAWCVRYGKTWADEQVRPAYARHIAERLALEAEISAAREAQLRLLPQSAPNITGLNIAAACVPAETVGGDFYDFFPLGEGRIGIFIAEGNGRGLAAALLIALAKGFLMHCVSKMREPAELLTRLENALGSILENSSAQTHLAFAVVDSVAGVVRYARTGDYPKVLVTSRQSRGGAAVAIQTERWITMKGRSEPIAEGSATIAPGDHILLFTNGVARRLTPGRLAQQDAPIIERKLCLVASDGDPSAAAVQQRMFRAGKAPDETDDLTAVVIQVESVGAGALSVVA